MPKLNQVIAAEKDVKSDTLKQTAAIYHSVQKTDPLRGISRTYQPLRDDPSEQLPSETTRVQTRVSESIGQFEQAMSNLFDLVATKDWANTEARADIMVDGKALLTGVPATYLLFLEKQLIEIRTFLEALPVLDPSESWHYDPNTDSYATEPSKTMKTKKEPRNWVKAEATEKHPAQVEMFYEDVNVGTWTTIKYSGAIPQKEKTELLERLAGLRQAVKFAREEANGLEVKQQQLAKPIFDYLFHKS